MKFKYFSRWFAIIMSFVLMVTLGYWAVTEVDAADIQYAERNVQINRWQINKGRIGSKRYFELYLKTLHPAGRVEDGAVMDTSDTHTSSDSHIYYTLKDGYEVVGYDPHGDGGRSNMSGNRITVYHSTKANNARGTLTVQFTGFNVTYDLGAGGTFQENGGASITKKSNYGEAQIPAYTLKPGYHFTGWSGSTDITSSRTLVAQYRYDFIMSGEAINQTQTVSQGEKAVQPADPHRVGYTFSGWYSDPSFVNHFDFNTPLSGPTTIYGKWNVNRHTITFQSGEGATQVSSLMREYGKQIGTLATPQRAGYRFLGWKDAGGKDWTDKSLMLDASFTLYAQWERIKYTVNFASGEDATQIPSQEHFYHETVKSVEDPERPGYKFLGWSTDASGKGSFWDFEKNQIEEALTLHALWRELEYYDVTFDTNGGTVIEPVLKQVEETLLEEPDEPVRKGHTFTGWYTQEGVLWDFTEDMLTQTMTLTAQWSRNQYPVSFDVGEAWTSPILSQDVLFEGYISQPNRNPRRLGYEFAGWRLFENRMWDFNEDRISDAPTVLQATYQKRTYAVSFDGNAGNATSVPATLHAEYQAQVAQPGNPFRQGYRFVGWNTQRNGAGQSWEQLFAKGMVLNDVTLYAQWEQR